MESNDESISKYIWIPRLNIENSDDHHIREIEIMRVKCKGLLINIFTAAG